jgi:quercetin dioxygenase-like cupin family protein
MRSGYFLKRHVPGRGMKINRLDQVEKNKMAMEGAKDTYKQIPISARDGTPSISFRVFTIEPGGHTPYHSHPFEHLNYIIEGAGALKNEQGDERPLSKGDFVLILPNEVHQYKNASAKGNLVMICAVPKEYE